VAPSESGAHIGEVTGAGARRIEASIRGRVQGVGFRYFVRREAIRLGLGGWVSNERDGSVRLVAEGPQDALEELVRSVSDGPADALVEDVSVDWGEGTGGFDRFGVRAGGHPGD
jgi:acylphosphatase